MEIFPDRKLGRKKSSATSFEIIVQGCMPPLFVTQSSLQHGWPTAVGSVISQRDFHESKVHVRLEGKCLSFRVYWVYMARFGSRGAAR